MKRVRERREKRKRCALLRFLARSLKAEAIKTPDIAILRILLQNQGLTLSEVSDISDNTPRSGLPRWSASQHAASIIVCRSFVKGGNKILFQEISSRTRAKKNIISGNFV